ncbi:hypothetical protein A3Q56_00749 [Intoshia linei]|uniref:DNA repair and recombination protein RAD54-like n=1 Tax=Intoshia linei TaxID=1819745 RepID=A0A177BD90_9BILA|nr:hypothetical protein A3Q56_00749 [Intoshia linei]
MRRSNAPTKLDNPIKRLREIGNDSDPLLKKYKVPIPGYRGSLFQRRLGTCGSIIKKPLYDPTVENALILYKPIEMSEHEKLITSKDKIKVHVVCDPRLTKYLRPHQREGVKFMYDCVTGSKIENNFGCIMADEMGLGKTLQCITLIWTLLRQSPDTGPYIKLCLIICPSSLIKNWSNEFTKWLPGLIGTIDVDAGNKTKVDNNLKKFTNQRFTSRTSYPVLIISYETLRSHIAVLKNIELDLMICDEGHRLKNKENLTYKSLTSLRVRQKILLSATPVQNDLLEYFSLINFVNTGILGESSEFKKKYEIPIQRGREREASEKEKIKGEERRRELIGIVEKCMIRRTQALLTQYLPVKVEMVVCCEMTDIQKSVYEGLINYSNVDLNSSKVSAKQLSLIMQLRKVCNHPKLVYDYILSLKCLDLKNIFPNGFQNTTNVNPHYSGKLNTLAGLLKYTKMSTDDRFVIVSNFTQTLDLLEQFCREHEYICIRLDGTMTSKKRAKVVKMFNDKNENVFIMMLSSKAGGCGLNLIGGNRLVLFDPDWNPANDDQAAARIWRDGQKKISYIYRFVATGSIDEKIFERQQHKKSLSKSIIDTEGDLGIEDLERIYSSTELRKLFKSVKKTISETHDSLNCKRCVNSIQVSKPPDDATCELPLSKWNHYSDKKYLRDVMIKQSWGNGISFVFEQVSHYRQIVTI